MGSLNFKDPKFYTQHSKNFIDIISKNHIPQQHKILSQQIIQSLSLSKKRTKINPQGIFPLCSIGHLEMHHPLNPKLKFNGTCILIDNHILLTCAHNIYNYEEQMYYKVIDFYPNAHGKLQDKHKHKIRIELTDNFKIIDKFYKYKTKEHQNYDYGIIFMKQNNILLDQHYGTIKLSKYKVQKADDIYLFGYPTSDNDYKDEMYLYGSKGHIQVIKQHTLYYDIQTQAGQSGSPLFIFKQNQWRLIGIHTVSDPSGILLNEESLKTINQWINIKETSLKIEDIKSLPLHHDHLKIEKMFDKNQNWSHLTYLTFSNCKLDSKDILKLNKSSWNLKQLNLSNNLINLICLQPAKFVKLQILNVDNNLISEIKKDINNFVSLRTLSLVNNKIQKISIVIENVNLQIILYGNKISKNLEWNKSNNTNKNYIV